jgi:hypothetical protein
MDDSENKILQISDNGVGIDLVKNADKNFGMYIKHLQSHRSKRYRIVYYQIKLMPWVEI